MSLDRRTGESPPVRGLEELVSWFREHERPAAEWKVGIEHEKLAIRAGTVEPLPYGGPSGVEALLRGFSRYGYTPFDEAGHVIAAQHRGLTVSIEPGGQVELSGRPFKDIHEVAAELDRHLEKCRGLAQDLGIEFLAAGYRPWGTPSSVPWMPKARYQVMRPFLEERGRLAADMMAMTGSTQASFDFGSERDMAEKLRVALAVQPAVVAACANAPVVDGRESGWRSFRVQVWNHVDPARCGLLAFALDPGFDGDAYRRYAEWALDVPMVFLRRGGRYLASGGRTFRRFLREGLEGERATVDDWEDHLTTLFPEARVKGVVEVRGTDAVEPGLVKALAAFWKGILYSKESRDWAWDQVRRFTLAERRALMDAAGREGLSGRAPDGRTLREILASLLQASSDGLCRQNCCGETGDDERIWLAPLRERAASGRSPADEALEAFRRGGDRALAAALRCA
ncbi:MAG TPA: glutamate-cysteine ligase family protein [Anaeromyxobacteraceae bacterium]|nr:glutamate-cysteine ligase family protein [Anaeromyxobacteraceae bacterium]